MASVGMDHDDYYASGWDGEPVTFQAINAWPPLTWDEGTLRHMGEQEDMLSATTTEPSRVHAELPLLLGSSTKHNGSFASLDYHVIGSSMAQPDSDAFHFLGLHSLKEPGLAPLGNDDYEIGTSIERSVFHEPTPSLTMSPLTSFTSDFDPFMGEIDRQLSQDTPSNDDHGQRHAGIASAKCQRQRIRKSRKTSPKSRAKSIGEDKTPSSHPHTCNQCVMRFRQPGELRKHEKAAHRPENERPRVCDDCGKRFNWPKDLRRHKRRVHKDLVASDNTIMRAEHSDYMIDDTGTQEASLDLTIPDVTGNDLDLYFQHDPYDKWSSTPTTQQDWLCNNNNPDHHTFSRTHSPGEGSAPHRGARV